MPFIVAENLFPDKAFCGHFFLALTKCLINRHTVTAAELLFLIGNALAVVVPPLLTVVESLLEIAACTLPTYGILVKSKPLGAESLTFLLLPDSGLEAVLDSPDPPLLADAVPALLIKKSPPPSGSVIFTFQCYIYR